MNVVIVTSRPRLPIIFAPLTGETLTSYLSRLTTANYLQRTWLPKLAKEPGFTRQLSALTGYTEHQLVCALPALRTAATLRTWPHLIGQVSARAPSRPACTDCVVARTGGNANVNVFASHEQLVCVRHQRWVGTGDLPCPRPHQFRSGHAPISPLPTVRTVLSFGAGAGHRHIRHFTTPWPA